MHPSKVHLPVSVPTLNEKLPYLKYFVFQKTLFRHKVPYYTIEQLVLVLSISM